MKRTPPHLLVKICGLTRERDALAAAEAGADLAGFVFVRESPRFIPPERAAEVCAHLPRGVRKVGVFAGAEPEEIRRVARLVGLDYAQLHCHEPVGPPASPGLRAGDPGVPVIRALRVGGAEDLLGAEDDPAELLLLDARVAGALGGTGKAFEWSLARDLCRKRKVLVAGGLTPDNVGEAVRALSPYGVDVSSGVEASPGVKDHAKVREFIRAARAAAGNVIPAL